MSNRLGSLPLCLACLLTMAKNSSAFSATDVVQTPLEMAKLAVELPSGYTVFPDIGVAYKLFRDPIDWYDARKYCIREGGNLAVIDSSQKVEYVMNLKVTTTQPDIHIGMHRFFNNEWIEVKTELAPTMIPWRAESFVNDLSRKCTVLDHAVTGVVASHCNGLYHFVCEISLFKK